jgi:RNA polymerase sigma-70 factor (ECF subfamily)
MQRHLRLRRGIGAEAAEELAQAFVVSKILERHLIARADRGKGRFRTFLLTALDRFAANALRDERLRRGVPLEGLSGRADPAPTLDEAADAVWAREVLGHALRRMRDECRRHARDDVWAVFEGRLIAPALDDARPVPYEDLVRVLQRSSTSEGFNLLATAKRAFARALRSVVGEYEKDAGRIEEEITALRAALSRRAR